MAKIGVILSGCGVFDGTEIHEAILTMLALERSGADVVYYAPDAPQMHVVDHSTGTPSSEQRNILAESARISRGNIKPLSEADAQTLDAVIVPGGFGAAKNLCTFAVAGASMEVRQDVARLLESMFAQKKPLGFICIAPVIAAKLFSGAGVVVTVGAAGQASEAIEAMGAVHIVKSAEEVHVDEANRIVSTPAYMVGQSMSEIAVGIDLLVAEVLNRA